jgi:hypothetical protein
MRASEIVCVCVLQCVCMCVDVGVVMGQLGVFGNVVLRLIRKSDLANFSSTYAICTKTIVHTHAHTRAYTHTRIHTHVYTHKRTYMHTQMYAGNI